MADIQSDTIVTTRSGEVLTLPQLIERIKDAAGEFGGDLKKDEDSALAALGVYDLEEGVTLSMSDDEIESFLDSFVEAWASM